MKKLVLAILFSMTLFTSFGSHIIGSEITYESLGNDDYKVRLTLYRDCQFTGVSWPAFDSQSFITVFKGDSSLFYSYPMNTSLVADYDPDSVMNLPVELSSQCWIPPSNVCIDQAIYEFIINLPFDSLGYFIVYQRCCRDNLLTNISNSGQTGMTNFLLVSKEAQQLQNNSSTFSKSPPVVICKDRTNYIDMSATDIDGDSLVYRLCNPLLGASVMSPQPQVASPPPFSAINYITGFSLNQPITGVMSIDGKTGLITVSPTASGQYVVVVCIDEYRNGVLIGSIRRDIVVQVVDCQSMLVAHILADSIGQNQDYYINATDTVVTFLNQSGQLQFIDSYLWEFELDSQTVVTSTLLSPTVTFPSAGIYHGQLTVNPNSPDCKASLFIIVNIQLSTRNYYMSKKNNIQIHPNPVHDFLSITFEESFFDKKKIEIFDIRGVLIKEIFIKPNQTNTQISVKNLPKGNYVVRVDPQIFKIIKL